jgi:hypothetical protein
VTWVPPPDWQDDLRHELSAAAFNAGLSMADVGRRMKPHYKGAASRTTPLMWVFGKSTVLPNVRTLVRYCAAIGIRPSDILRRAGL